MLKNASTGSLGRCSPGPEGKEFELVDGAGVWKLATLGFDSLWEGRPCSLEGVFPIVGVTDSARQQAIRKIGLSCAK